MSIFEDLSTEDLFLILKTENTKQLKTKFGAVTTREFIQGIHHHRYPRKMTNKVSQSIYNAITDAPTYPLLILWSVIGLITLKVLTLSLLTGGLGTLMLVTGGIFYVATYYELKKEAQKNDKFFWHAAIRNECADVLLKRLRGELHNKYNLNSLDAPEIDDDTDSELPLNLSDKKVLPRIKDAVKASLLVGSTLFGTYYFGVSSIIAAFGLTAISTAMLGPIGLGIALAVTFGIGIYFGYKQYQISKSNQTIKKIQKHKLAKLDAKIDKCNELKDRLDQKPFMKIQAGTAKNKKLLTNQQTSPRRKIKFGMRLNRQPNFLVNANANYGTGRQVTKKINTEGTYQKKNHS